ncbi:uncharacterized protein LOC111265912 [Varroa jacobsoni]|uniref:uncharacterized protein LOC111265912 n=1 Tax=Varroa jacobsoni TaxID=62625 RepID=UPI000BF77ED4|nr:uncharacterized protein LOC111265912 [Varroa jacobsoni]
MDREIEKDVSVLSGLFTFIITDLKGSTPIWEDFLMKTGKLHSQLKVTMSCLGTFVEAMQRIADMATSAQGATRDVGKALTRLCLRHRAFENRLKALIDALQDALIIPMTDKIEDWKRITTQIDRTHSKEFKRARSELKKKNTDTLRLRKKVKRASAGVGPGGGLGGMGGAELAQKCLSNALQGMHDDYILLEENQRQAVRRALIEQRRRYCAFVHCIKPVMDEEVRLLEEVSHLEEVVESLCKLTTSPERLPTASEQVIEDAKMGHALMSESIYGYHSSKSPPSSPGSSLGSRKSSMCSISSESNSADIYGNTHRARSLSQPPPLQVSRLCSVSSQDSGFNSTHDGNGLRKAGHRNLENLFQRQGSSDENSPAGGLATGMILSASNPIYDSRPPLKQHQQQESSQVEHAGNVGSQGPPCLPRRNNSLPSNSLFDSRDDRCKEENVADADGGNSTSMGMSCIDACRSEPQSPQLTHRALSVTGQTPPSSDNNYSKAALFLARTPSQHMSTLPVRGRDRSRKVPPAPPIRRTPPTSTLNVAFQLRQLEEQGRLKQTANISSHSGTCTMSGGDSAAGTGKSEAAKSPDLPLPSPPAELLSPSEENSIYGRMIKSCHATLERPTRHQTSGTAQAVIGQGGAGGYHHSPDQSSTYHDDHNAYLGGICSQITEKFGGADSSNSPNSNSYNNHNIYGTFGKGKRNTYRRIDSQESDQQTNTDASAGIKEVKDSAGPTSRQGSSDSGTKLQLAGAAQRNSKMYKCASSDDILGARAGSWASSPSAAQEENLYEPLNKELNESIYGGSSFGVSIAISTNDTYGSTSHQLAASANGAGSGRPGAAPPAPPERRTPQRRAQSFSNDLYGTIEDDIPHTSRSKVQQVKETFEHLRQVSANEPLYGRVSQSQSTSSRCSSPSNRQGTSPFPSNKLSMYQGPQESLPGAQNQSTSQHHHSQFSIYATKNEVLTPGVPVSIPKVPTDLSKKRFMQQLNEKLAQGTSQANQQQQSQALQPNMSQGSSIYGTLRSCNTATIGKGRRCSSESRNSQNGLQQQQQRVYGYVGGATGESEISPATHRVQEWLSGRPPIKDIGECKRSVLDQIRKSGKSTPGGPPRL